MSIYVWDASSWNNTPLYRLGGGGVPFILWAPTDDKILATSPTSIFRHVTAFPITIKGFSNPFHMVM